MLRINHHITIGEDELEMRAVRAQGPGGQNVNKVSSAVHLRFDIRSSSLPERLKQTLLALSDYRVTKDGVIVIKARESRSQERNREIARTRLIELISGAALETKRRRPTKPSINARARRLDTKIKRGRTKSLRGRIVDHE
ncbi:MAG: alternative ribosome rescue aminoacyl-tRNA hydrolase ArfB [Proteobacteria bacterium]|nr:alternative ribosome rescue aminoacyl-tRNA hydrolase ArfB [Pseudomonadota bacterium]